MTAGPVADIRYPEYSAPSRTERLIAGARILLTLAALITLSLDPTQPAKYGTTYSILGLYVAYALGLVGLAWRVYMLPRQILLVTHAIDLVAPSIMVALFEGPPISPFFVFFVFSMFSATLRWNWRGTLATAACALGLFGAVGYVVDQFVADELVYLAVVAGLLAYMGAHEQRRRSEVSKLAAWPPAAAADLGLVVREALQHGAGILRAPRVLLAWEEPEEPRRYLAYVASEEFQLVRDASDGASLVAPSLVDAVFFCPDVRAPQGAVLTVSGFEGPSRCSEQPIVPALQARFSIVSVLSVPLSGDEWTGRLFFFDMDRARVTVDETILAQIVGQHITARLDHQYLLQRLQRSAIVDVRTGFARDLHDGLLQSLTGMALQVHTAVRLLGDAPERATEQLRDVQSQIFASQQSLRTYIQELKVVAGRKRPAAALGTMLRALQVRIEREWGLTVDLATPAAVSATEAAGLAHHIAYVVNEALVNAVRHGGASHASVRMEEQPGEVVISVTDNGRGFPFHGRYDILALDDLRAGPVTLKERITALRGDLVVDSSPSGAKLLIRLPFSPAQLSL